MNSRDIIDTTKRLTTEHGCPTALQEYHGEVLGAIKDTLDNLVKKIDAYENIPLFNGPDNDQPLSRPRKAFLQELYVGNKKIDVLSKEFEEHKKKTFGKEASKISSFMINVVLPLVMLLSILFNIYSFINNRSDFVRSDKLQKTIEQTEKNH
jgi:uncharacterized protein YqhQ